jgi:hypothetical protein
MEIWLGASIIGVSAYAVAWFCAEKWWFSRVYIAGRIERRLLEADSRADRRLEAEQSHD